MLRLLSLGDNVVDMYLHTGMMYPGGQALNFSVYASMLGAKADFMGVFGNDEAAALVKRALREKGIGHRHCRTYEGENGRARVTLKEGDRVFLGSNRGGVIQQHPICLTERDLSYAAGFDLIHTTNNGFLDGLLPELYALQGRKGHPVWISYDFSGLWDEERLERVCPVIDFGFVSCGGIPEEECRRLLARMAGLGTRVAVATRGSEGALVMAGKEFFSRSASRVEPVDTLGAGDSFAAALLVELLTGILRTGTDASQERMLSMDVVKQGLSGALAAAADFSAGICLVQGAFGEGVPIPEAFLELLST